MSCCIDWLPTGKANTSTRKERLPEERVFFALPERTSTGPRPEFNRMSTKNANASTGKERLLEERKCFLHSSTGRRPRRGNRLIDTPAG